jgi:hypothetical protein
MRLRRRGGFTLAHDGAAVTRLFKDNGISTAQHDLSNMIHTYCKKSRKQASKAIMQQQQQGCTTATPNKKESDRRQSGIFLL